MRFEYYCMMDLSRVVHGTGRPERYIESIGHPNLHDKTTQYLISVTNLRLFGLIAWLNVLNQSNMT
jgi:hypothetical protein